MVVTSQFAAQVDIRGLCLGPPFVRFMAAASRGRWEVACSTMVQDGRASRHYRFVSKRQDRHP